MNESEAAFYDNNAYATPDPKADYGRCSYDVKNQFKGSVVWNLPATHFAWTVPNLILSNWQVNGIVTLRSGQPFSALSGIDNSTSGIGSDRADVVGNPWLSNSRSNIDKVKKYFNTAAFTTNALGTYGNTRRNFLIGPGYQNVDFSLVRMFPLKGHYLDGSSLQFRAESFNLLNRPNFSNPNATVSSSAAGTITSASDPRILQLALKMSF
jgi:hypothetical protein